MARTTLSRVSTPTPRTEAGGDAATTRDTGRLGRLLGAGVWLVFLGNPLGRLLDHADTAQAVSGTVALAVFVAVYLVGLVRVRWFHLGPHVTAAWGVVAAMLLCFAVVVPGAQEQSLTMLVFVAAFATAALPAWQALTAVAACFVAITAAGTGVDGWATHGNNFAVLLAAAAVWSFRLAWQRAARLQQAERDLAELAVEDERSRISRDLHDILGHSLTVITVKAELAERLLDSDPERARSELQQLRALGREALADVRSTARGIRSVSLPAEIASARVALETAGITPALPTVVDDVPTRWRELFAWTLREGVTNVIRHSGATRCEVDLAADRIRVADDGRGCPGGVTGAGLGLEGLRHRAEHEGATVSTESRGDGFVLTVRVPT